MNIDRANLVNYILNNSNNSPTYYRNIKKSSDLNLTDNKFIIDEDYYDKKDDHTEADHKNHFIEFKIPIFLKDISDFFRKLDLLQYAEFTIDITLDEELFVTTIDGISYEIKGCNLFVEEVKLTEEDKIKYLKMLKNNYVKKINFLENHTNIYNDKLNILENNFHLNNVRNADSVLIYGISKIRKVGKNFQLPNIQFKKAYMQIDNIKFENGIPNDISAYQNLKYRSNHPNNFLISYEEFLNNYRIYLFNVNRKTQGNLNNKFIIIISGLNDTNCDVYTVWRNYATITLKYNSDDYKLEVYKSY